MFTTKLLLVVAGFSDAGGVVSTRAREPASEKRQGTKSREVGFWRCRGRYGVLIRAPVLGCAD